jgi:hypothetical protein
MSVIKEAALQGTKKSESFLGFPTVLYLLQIIFQCKHIILSVRERKRVIVGTIP